MDTDESQFQLYNPFEEFINEQQNKSKKQQIKKSIQNLPQDGQVVNDNDFQVNKIKDRRYVKGKPQYLIEWVNYKGQDTWQYEENLQYVKGMIDTFQKGLRLKQKMQKGKELMVVSTYNYDLSCQANGLSMQQCLQQQNQEYQSPSLSYISSEMNNNLSKLQSAQIQSYFGYQNNEYNKAGQSFINYMHQSNQYLQANSVFLMSSKALSSVGLFQNANNSQSSCVTLKPKCIKNLNITPKNNQLSQSTEQQVPSKKMNIISVKRFTGSQVQNK